MQPIKLSGSQSPRRPSEGEVLSYMGWTLHYTIGDVIAAPVKVGDVVETSKGESLTITGGNPPHKPSSSGFVWVTEGPRSGEFYPSVVGAKWVPDDG